MNTPLYITMYTYCNIHVCLALPQNLLTTNWQIVRLKLPVPEQNIGWRVEFRTMEVGLHVYIHWHTLQSVNFMFSYICAPFQLQLTASENAAFAVFVMLLARTILSLRPNLYIPISKVNCIYCLDPCVCSLIAVYIRSLLTLIHTHSWMRTCNVLRGGMQ